MGAKAEPGVGLLMRKCGRLPGAATLSAPTEAYPSLWAMCFQPFFHTSLSLL